MDSDKTKQIYTHTNSNMNCACPFVKADQCTIPLRLVSSNSLH